MKTIAISIDEKTLGELDRLVHVRGEGAKTRGGGVAKGPVSRSAIVRSAVQEYVHRRDKTRRNEADREALAKHRRLLALQAAAVVAEQERR